MIFRPASEEEFEAVKKKYQDVAEHTPEIRRYARWEYGKHPTDEGIRRYIDNGEMYLLMNGDEIAGMTAVVMYQERDYEAVQWAEMLDNDQVATLFSIVDGREKLFFILTIVILFTNFFGWGLYFAGHQSIFVMLFFIVAMPPLYYVAIGLWRQNTPLVVTGAVFLAVHFFHVLGNLRSFSGYH